MTNTSKYACAARLIVMSAPLKSGRVLILADNGGVQPYVVSEYTPGATEWISGRYFSVLSDAATDYESRQPAE